MSYSHYGEIGDLWKHLPLCSFLSIEKVSKYLESNAAFPIYSLTHHTDERDYGIVNLLAKSNLYEFNELKDTPYIKTLLSVQDDDQLLSRYLGSPGLAMKLLGKDATYVFCDIEKQALDEIINFSKELSTTVEVKEGDSIENLWHVIEEEGPESYLHIDPYEIFKRNENGRSYFDLFVKSMNRGIKTMLWYGYETKQQQQAMYEKMNQYFKKFNTDLREHRVHGIEVEMEIIGEEIMTVNPGVPGCGVIIANMSYDSINAFHQLNDTLIRAYENMKYQGLSGRLNKRITFKN